eukprot:SM000019S04950  [mRNA]  locus=s19:178346:179645:- [translate_table: standard]
MAALPWELERVLGAEELEERPPVAVFVARLPEPKAASALIHRLAAAAPLPGLAHVKRVRRDVDATTGAAALSIVLCAARGERFEAAAVLPEEAWGVLSAAVEAFGLAPYPAALPAMPPRTRAEWEEQARLWPTSFHPNVHVRPPSAADFGEQDLVDVKRFMDAALCCARRARSLGHPANGAVIVDPAARRIVAEAVDQSGGWGCEQPLHGKDEISGSWHPLRHA